MSDTQETTETTAPHMSPRLITALTELRDLTANARAAVRPYPAAVQAQAFLDAVERPGGIAATPEGQERAAEAAEALIRNYPRPDLHDLAKELS